MNCNCSICENHEYDSPNRMTFDETMKYIRGDLGFLNGRKSYLTFYNYCPFCGKKIDWKIIKTLAKKIKV